MNKIKYFSLIIVFLLVCKVNAATQQEALEAMASAYEAYQFANDQKDSAESYYNAERVHQQEVQQHLEDHRYCLTSSEESLAQLVIDGGDISLDGAYNYLSFADTDLGYALDDYNAGVAFYNMGMYQEAVDSFNESELHSSNVLEHVDDALNNIQSAESSFNDAKQYIDEACND